MVLTTYLGLMIVAMEMDIIPLLTDDWYWMQLEQNINGDRLGMIDSGKWWQILQLVRI